MKNKIVLIGYMGSGKSTVAKILSKITQTVLLDLDDFIERATQKSISEIFREKGEKYFRNLENLYLQKLLNRREELIISVGGGTPCYSGNMDLINQKAQSVYLRSTVEGLYKRLVLEKDERPLIASISDTDLKGFISEHLAERAAFYEKALYIIDTDRKNPEEVAKEIRNLI